jgi:ATP-dependent RNA helicase DDX21
MLKQGFQEDIEKIFEFIKKNGPSKKTQNLLFSATVPSWVLELSRTYLSPDRDFVDLIKDSEIRTSKTVEHLGLNCPYYHRNAVISDVVNLYGGRHGRTIIFCETKKEANEILLKANLKQETQVLHGDIPQKQREVTFQSFKEGKLKCLVATNVAARGLDIPEVDLIVQLEPPKEIDTYIHRSGRTGRAGKSGVCLTFFTKAQLSLLERIERVTKIKLKKIGPPQPGDIVKASARDIVISLKQVEPSVLQYFEEIAEEMIAEDGAVKSLATALAFISGNTKKISQRSLLCSMEGYITYLVKCPTEYQSPGFIFSFLRKNTNEDLSESIKGMRRISKKSAAFDVPEKYKAKMDKLIEECQKEDSPIKDYEVAVVDKMEMLSDDEDEGH